MELQTLDFDGGFYAYPNELVDFLGRHASTLQHLLLDKTCLMEDELTWHSVFDRLRTSLINLKTIHLNYLHTLANDDLIAYGWSRAFPEQRVLLDNACRWILGNGEPTEADLEGFEDVQCTWQSLAKDGQDARTLGRF